MISIVEDRENDFSRSCSWPRSPTDPGGREDLRREPLVALFQGVCVVAFAAMFGVPMAAAQLARWPALRRLLPARRRLWTGHGGAVPNQRTAMEVFQFLIIPQYVLGGVLVPVHGVPGYINVIAE